MLLPRVGRVEEAAAGTPVRAILARADFRRLFATRLLSQFGDGVFQAALAGTVLAQFIQSEWMRWIVGIAFLGFAGWALIPDTLEDQSAEVQRGFWAIFWTTASAFFLIEMGDKTQVATALLAARFESLPAVVAGSTLGMMLVNGPAVLLGETAARRLPLKWIRIAAAAGFAATGLWILFAG